MERMRIGLTVLRLVVALLVMIHGLARYTLGILLIACLGVIALADDAAHHLGRGNQTPPA